MEQEGIFEGIEKTLWSIGEKACELHGLTLVEMEVEKGKGKWLVRFYVDRQDLDETGIVGVNIDDCAQVSRAISKLLDVKDPIDSAYTLEVSSPGLERPLRREEDFKTYIESVVRIKVKEPISGRKNFTGIITDVSEKGILIKTETEDEFLINLKNIKKARLKYQYD